MPARISRSAYAEMFGPTVGDKVRLADTDLIIEVEKDFTTYGEEVKFGGGKVIRDGMGQSQATRAEGAVDTVITNALIIDHWGIVKADVGLQGRPHRRASARPAIRTSSPASTSSSAPAPRRSPAKARSSPPAASTPHPLHLPAADRGGADVRRHHDARRRHRPGDRHQRHHLHARPLASRPHDPGGRRLSR